MEMRGGDGADPELAVLQLGRGRVAGLSGGGERFALLVLGLGGVLTAVLGVDRGVGDERDSAGGGRGGLGGDEGDVCCYYGRDDGLFGDHGDGDHGLEAGGLEGRVGSVADRCVVGTSGQGNAL